ncbi:TMEM164-related integral membrane acyltransferase [Streptococcus porcinus]|uniref:TIGR02206 family membrane protein n=1 Tax=Streptococcus porcinus TaxID=1340 RepID=A0A7V9WRF7_STRPO|nr:TIGR02206 family membrane protein [Streptococcus porcinus]MBA2795727.1 TIGR02206 family membrane protein [Streptococcus porcinus]
MNFFALTPTELPRISLQFYLFCLVLVPVLIYLTLNYYQKKGFRYFFLALQLFQLITFYGWYILKGFPAAEALPLYHCRIGMLAIFFFPNKTKLKQLLMLLGIGGSILALFSPDLYPYPLTHVTNFAFYIGHYALLVNALVYLLQYYDRDLSSSMFSLTFLATLHFSLMIVNILTGGNYGFVMELPLLHSRHLVGNFCLLTLGLWMLARLVELVYVRYYLKEEAFAPLVKG